MPRTRSTTRVVAYTTLGAVLAAGLMTTAVRASGSEKKVVAEVRNAAGTSLGTVKFAETRDEKTLVRAKLLGLTPGFHGFHVHGVGICDPSATDAAGNPSPFFTASGHYNPGAGIHAQHAGDLPPLLVASDGTAVLRVKTDRFTPEDLLDANGSAVIVHAAADNLAHIPAVTPAGAPRYHSHVEDVFGPDTSSKATGDAGARAACGVVAD